MITTHIKTTPRLIVGFSLVLVLMVILVIISLQQMASMNLHLDKIVKNSVVKIELANNIDASLREQTTSLYYVSTTKDSLQRGQEFERLGKYSLELDRLLIKLSGLENESAKKTFITTIQNRVNALELHVDLASEYVFLGNETLAHDIIHTKILPEHREISQQIKSLVSVQREQNIETVDIANESYKDAKLQLIIIGSASFIISLFIAVSISLLINRQTKALTYQALHDNLTGLATRALFDNHLDLCLHKSKRSGEHFSVIVMDLDGFKQINDTYGHKAGDEVLSIVSERLSATLRVYDTISRMGGDEFFMLLVDTNLDTTLNVIQRIAGKVKEDIIVNDSKISVGISIGIATFPDHGTSSDQLVKAADSAMYIAKNNRLGIKVAEPAAKQYSNILTLKQPIKK